MTWDGKERRKNSRANGGQDHDILIEIRSDLKNFMRRFSDHCEDANTKFKGLFDRTAMLQKFMWIIIGGFIVVELYFKFGK